MFKKYTEIENSYREKYIRDFFDRHPEMAHKKYTITEKIDGSNISFIFAKDPVTEDVSFAYAKRSGLILPDENFFGIQAYVDSISDFVDSVRNSISTALDQPWTTFTMFGEYFGPGIQKRINYGNSKRAVFFDICIDGQYVSQERFFSLMAVLDSKGEFTIPLLSTVDSFDEALQFNTHFNSVIGPACEDLENECEGVVIKPFDAGGPDNPLVDQYGHHEHFYVKMKNKKFAEKTKTKSRSKNISSSALVAVQELFAAYLNENRIQSVFSKEGPISDVKDMGKYIKLIVEDAKADFLKDEAETFYSAELSDKERGKVFSIAGKIISKELLRLV
jgi:Rnl2 family RNA ligase